MSCAVIDSKLVLRDGDDVFVFSGAVLRPRCRCAECRARALSVNGDTGLSKTDGALLKTTDDATDISVIAASPLGYGVQLHFSDGHNRGIFPWTYLRRIAAETARQ